MFPVVTIFEVASKIWSELYEVNFICKQLVFLTFQPRDSKGFISVGEPLFLTPLVEAGKLEEAREASKVFFLPVLEK